MKYRFIFWDNDGVLVATESLYYQANREALARRGMELTEAQFRSMSLTNGQSVLDLANRVNCDAAQAKELRRWRNARYAELLAAGDLVLPGVREVLLRLHGKVGMAIVTSARREHFDIIHRNTGLLPLFDFVLTREDYARSKPDPEPYLLALANSRHPPRDCLVIEDSPRGLAAAKAAGLTCWVTPSAETAGADFSDADGILGEIGEVAERLLQPAR